MTSGARNNLRVEIIADAIIPPLTPPTQEEDNRKDFLPQGRDNRKVVLREKRNEKNIFNEFGFVCGSFHFWRERRSFGAVRGNTRLREFGIY